MKVIRGIDFLFLLLIVLLHFSLKNGSQLNNSTRKCPDVDIKNGTLVATEFINNQSQLDLFFKRILDDYQTVTCVKLVLTGNELTLDIVQLMRINATKLIVIGNGTIDMDCTANATDVDTLKDMVQPISSTLLVLFDGLVFNKCPVPILIEEVAVVMIFNCVFT